MYDISYISVNTFVLIQLKGIASTFIFKDARLCCVHQFKLADTSLFIWIENVLLYDTLLLN